MDHHALLLSLLSPMLCIKLSYIEKRCSCNGIYIRNFVSKFDKESNCTTVERSWCDMNNTFHLTHE